MLGVGHLDENLVLPGRQRDDDQRVGAAEVTPMPGQVVDGSVEMPEPRREHDGIRPEHRQDAQVLHPVGDEHDALGQRTGKRRLHEQPGRGLIIDGYDGTLREGTGGDRGVFGKRAGAHCILSG